VRRIVVGIVWLLAIAGVVVLFQNTGISAQATFILAALIFVGVGTLIVLKVGNRLGWVTCLIGLALIGAGFADIGSKQGYLALGAISGTLWFGFFVLACFLMLWFPTGRVPSPRWRFVQWIGYYPALVAVSYLFADELCLEANDVGGCELPVDNPMGIPGLPNPEYGAMSGVNFAFIAVFLFLSTASLVTRFVRSRGTERLQLKWFASAAVGLVVIETVSEWLPLPTWFDDTLFSVTLAALPLSIGVAILRYRLFDIDRIISRTLGYALVVAILALLYAVVAIWIPSQIIGEQPPIFVAAATLAAAAAFNPLKRSILRTVDRRFHRSHYDTEVVMSNFAGRVRDQVDMDSLTNDWLGVVIRTMGPRTAGVWMRQP
jgi:hypothetical protein